MAEQLSLGLNLPEIEKPFRGPSFKPLQSPIWTEHKARLIERYLYYFVLITRHGTYIDGFAGPQEPDKPDTWAAKLVLESEPRWLRRFFLCDKKPASFKALTELVAQQPVQGADEPSREVSLSCNDFNQEIHTILGSKTIGLKEAAFCLLDQRTFECHWSTVDAIASYPKELYKIELFYFLGVKWLHRALSAQQDRAVLDKWWGRDDYQALRDKNGQEIAGIICQRLKDEHHYQYAYPWPIYERSDGGGAVMYFMIHATDHPDAPKLMDRAYRQAVYEKEPMEQIKIEFEQWRSGQ